MRHDFRHARPSNDKSHTAPRRRISDGSVGRRRAASCALCLLVASALTCGALVAPLRSAAADEASNAAAREERLLGAVQYLASDELEGRGVGTHGLDMAAEYLAAQFKGLGLKTDLFNGQAYQKFEMVTGTEMGERNEAAFVGPSKRAKGKLQRLELAIDKEFNPLSIGGSAKFDLPLVFVGYGITAKDEGYDDYDDYDGVDVEGKAVIVFRHEPQQDNPHSAFDGTRSSRHAPFVRKLSNAYEHGAELVIFCTDEHEIQTRVDARMKLFRKALDELDEERQRLYALDSPSLAELDQQRRKVELAAGEVTSQSERLAAEIDPLIGFRGAGSMGETASRLPAVHCRRSVLDAVLKAALGKDLATLEREIDQGPTPQSAELDGWRIAGEVNVVRTESEVKNVVAVLEGEGPHADETIVVGAHYDHLGMGGEGSFVPNLREVHNGADDNASGAAALIEVARILATRSAPLGRRVVFIGFTGEERGLIGSAQYCRDPLYPLDKTVAMLNMDMVGRMKDDDLIVQGFDTAEEFAALLDELQSAYGLKLARQPGGFGPSDHASFYGKDIPVLHFFTGLHSDYHRPSDDVERVNAVGMRRVAEMVADMAQRLADAHARPTFKKGKAPEPVAGGGGDRPYFGSIPDFAPVETGYAISGVAKGGPAEKGGLMGGDAIIRFGESRIGNLEDFDSALRKYKGGDKVPVVVLREGREVKLEVTLEPPR